MFVIIYIMAILISMPFVVKADNWSWGACLLYVGLCAWLTPLVVIPIWIWKTR